jgi:hypothetical protein
MFNTILVNLLNEKSDSITLYYVEDENGLYYYGKGSDKRNGFDSTQAKGFLQKKDAESLKKRLGRTCTVKAKEVQKHWIDLQLSDNTFTV